MRIALTSKGRDLDSEIDPRFGRAAYFLIVDTDNLEVVDVLDNSQNANAFKGAGIQAATLLSDKKVEVLLTGFCGPNAFRTLNAAKINVVHDINGSVKEAVQAFNRGELSFGHKANVEGHW